jgi:hypothetical protein
MACLIVRKQIKHVGSTQENIVIPSVRMRQIRDQAKEEQTGMFSVMLLLT